LCGGKFLLELHATDLLLAQALRQAEAGAAHDARATESENG
jgi:hypothetical protein